MRFFSAPSNRKDSLFYLTFQIFAQFAAADGKIVAGEIQAIERYARVELGISKRTLKYVFGIVRETKRGRAEFEKSVTKLYEIVHGNGIILESVFDVLLAIAMADHTFSIEEREFWIKAGEICGFTEKDLKRLMARHIPQPRMKKRKKRSFGGSSTNKRNDKRKTNEQYYQPRCYQILGATQQEDFESIKSKYRALVKKTHPDIVAKEGMPDEFRKTVEARFREIQEAYEEVCKLRGES